MMNLMLLFVEAAQVLLHRFGAGTDLQGMLSDFPGYARYIRGTPREYVNIRAEKVVTNQHDYMRLSEKIFRRGRQFTRLKPE
jgi:hypothetical protein